MIQNQVRVGKTNVTHKLIQKLAKNFKMNA